MHIIIHVVLLQIIDAVMETEDVVGCSYASTNSEMVCCKKSDCTKLFILVILTVTAEAWSE